MLRALARGAGAVGLALLLVPCSAADASTPIGEAYGSSGGLGCAGGTFIQTSSADNGYAVPFDGVITSWTSSGFDQDMTFKAARLGAGGSFTVIGSSGPQATGGTFPVRIPVRQGDVIGYHTPATSNCPYPTGAVEDVWRRATANVPAGSAGTFSTSSAGFLSIAAAVEHDADGDGYGDETQDLCPTDPTTHDACDVFPPDTSITKGPKKKTKSKSATFEFSSSEPGSTFECSLDSSGFKPCGSPDTVKVAGAGEHNFLVRARDSHGNLDTSEASWSWKLAKKKHKKHKH